MGLDLYAKIEPYLDFEDEIHTLHRAFLRFIMENNVDNIIDIGCGQGHFLQNLEINQKNAVGIDLSAEQIRVCKEEKGLDVKNIALKDVRKKFDCATAIFDVLNYIPKSELKDFILDTYRILNKNGYFLFDVNTYFGFDEVAQGTISFEVDNKFISIDANFENNTLQTNLTLFEQLENGFYLKEEEEIIQEYHEKEFLIKTLKDCGFEVLEVREFYLHTSKTADKLIFICKKID